MDAEPLVSPESRGPAAPTGAGAKRWGRALAGACAVAALLAVVAIAATRAALGPGLRGVSDGLQVKARVWWSDKDLVDAPFRRAPDATRCRENGKRDDDCCAMPGQGHCADGFTYYKGNVCWETGAVRTLCYDHSCHEDACHEGGGRDHDCCADRGDGSCAAGFSFTHGARCARNGAVSTCCKKASPAPRAPKLDNCLCLFDIDRTLTAMQGSTAKHCPSSLLVDGVWDSAFDTGTLQLSELSQNIQSTFCGRCYRGVISAGDAGGHNSEERTEILKRLGGTGVTLSSHWSSPDNVVSPMVVGAPDGFKQESARAVVDWFATQGVDIRDSHVHFFDDRDGNVPPFKGTGFNARQISCGTRDGRVGACGAALEEIVPDAGVVTCHGPA